MRTLKPWYETAAARIILADCAETAPALTYAATRDIEAGVETHAYDAGDPRVARLGDIRDTYDEAVVQLDRGLWRAGRLDIGVTEAIDLAIEAAKNAAAPEALRDTLLAQGLTLGQAEAEVARLAA